MQGNATQETAYRNPGDESTLVHDILAWFLLNKVACDRWARHEKILSIFDPFLVAFSVKLSCTATTYILRRFSCSGVTGRVFSYSQAYGSWVAYLSGHIEVPAFSFDLGSSQFIGLVVQGREHHWLLPSTQCCENVSQPLTGGQISPRAPLINLVVLLPWGQTNSPS